MDNEKSYSEAMNEWARKNSFFGDRGNRLIHPNPALSAPLRLVGYLFRILILVFIVGMAVNVGLRKYVGSKAFGEKAAGVVASMVKASEFESSPFLWKGKRMSMNRFSAKGGEGAFYHTLNAQYFRFDSSPLALLGAKWNLQKVVLNTLDLRLRSGAKMVEVPLSGSFEENGARELLLGGYSGRSHGGKTLVFEELQVLEANVDWGLSQATEGALVAGNLSFTPDDVAWRLEIMGGIFRQNWLQGVRIEKLTITPEGDLLHFKDGEISLAGGGAGTLSGNVVLGALPKVDLTLSIVRGALSDLVPEKYTTYADGKIEGTLHITGSINTKSGVEIAGDFRIADGILRNIPVMDSISILTETTRLRHLPVTTGTLKFTTRDGVLEVTELNLISKDTAHLTAEFSYARDMSKASEAELIGLDTPGADVSPLLCSGNLRIGVLPKSLENAKDVGNEYFSPESEGFRWLDIVLSGEIEQLTRSVYDRMLVDIRKLRDSR